MFLKIMEIYRGFQFLKDLHSIIFIERILESILDDLGNGKMVYRMDTRFFIDSNTIIQPIPEPTGKSSLLIVHHPLGRASYSKAIIIALQSRSILTNSEN
jgi:hypothetical protein